MRFFNPKVVASWPAANYVDPEVRGPDLYITNGIFFSLATMTVFTRMYTRIFVRKWFGLDDGLILFAWFCTAGDMATVFFGYSNIGWDRHMWDAKPEYLTVGAKATFVAKLFWLTASSLIRLSILCSFYRLLDHAQIQKYRWTLHIVTSFVIGIYLSYLGTTIFACVPVQAYFYWPSPGTCIVEVYTDTILAAFNTFSEFLIAALPIPVLFRLRMDSAQRWSVIGLLCLGFLVAVVGSVRTYYVWVLFSTDDMTWWAGPYWICSEVEISLAMICACAPSLAPTLRPFFSLLFFRLKAVDEDAYRSYSTRRSNSILQGDQSFTTKGSSYATQAEVLLSRSVDLEGIALDGFGYTVTITGGDPTRPKRTGRMWLPFSRRDVEESTTGTSRRQSLADFWPKTRAPSRQKGASFDLKSDNSRVGIVETKSLELRESFDGKGNLVIDRSWLNV